MIKLIMILGATSLMVGCHSTQRYTVIVLDEIVPGKLILKQNMVCSESRFLKILECSER